MKKNVIIVCIVILVIAIVAGTVMMFSKKDEDKKEVGAVKLETAQEMKDLINKIYTKLGDELPNLEIYDVDKNDEYALNAYTGLKSADNIETIVASEPMMSAQAYSLVMVKTNGKADIKAMKQEMIDNIDVRKWICVSAEKVYVTDYNDVIFLVMSNDDWAKPVYDEFKNLVGGKVGEELVRTEEI